MSKTIISLVDSAIIPAATMICGKVLGLFIVNIIFGLEWAIETDSDNLFSIRIVYNNIDDQIIAASYSNLIMYLFVAFGFSYVLISALYLHNSHVSPRMLANLATRNLLNLIKDSFTIYTQATVWLIFLWIAFVTILLNTFLGKSYAWVSVVTFCMSAALTVVLLRDVGQEIRLTKDKLNS